ncbi:MAG: DMT family transporter [Sneathiellales bacterium]|nr:DMT family transporter [Sneathiellales bacterium]
MVSHLKVTGINMLMTDRSAGVFFGILGMLGFSGTLVTTRLAVADFTPLDITCARIVIAGVLGAIYLFLTHQWKLPERRFLLSILVMGLGLAVGYPFFLALALETVPAVHGAVVTGLAPASTAIIAVLRTGERPPLQFWIACLAGFCAILYFAYDAGGGHLSLADGWLFLGMLSLGIAYVEGSRVSRELGSSVTLSWAMLFLTPLAILPVLFQIHEIDTTTISIASWGSMAYLGIVSMFLASVFWYRGLALGGIARIGQINLLLPLVALGWAAIFLGEAVTATAIICAAIVLAAMTICIKARQ